MAREGADAGIAHEIAVALERRDRRVVAIPLLHAEMQERVDDGERFIVRDVFLRLRCGEQRQRQMRRCRHRTSLL